ncbi:MAG TPA: HD-GYP domain-containing protein [Chloroflexia bacterium]|nr:HD-GYP domain-containing protein [Chloroflexia bacterium]
MNKTKILTTGYIFLLVLIALAVGFASLNFYRNQPDLLRDSALLILLGILAEHYNLLLSRHYEISTHPVVHIVAIFVLPPPIAIAVALISITVEQITSRAEWHKALFNAAHHVIITGFPAILVSLLDPTTGANLRQLDNHQSFYLLAPLVLITYYILDVSLVDVVIALSTGDSFWSLWRANNRKTLLFDFTLPAIGIIATLIWSASPVFCLLLFLPIAVNRFALSSLNRLEGETHKAIIAITELVEARDPYTFGHSLRVANFCREIALELGLNEAEAEQIALSGRVHDLGKIGVSDAILRKPGRLTEAEWVEMRSHAEIGANILANYSFFRKGLLDVLHHHESWDGKGYPANLSKEQIPVGARIIAVADSFDAMTTDRPYRKGMPVEKAVSILKERSDIQWEGRVVEAFLKVLARTELAEVTKKMETLAATTIPVLPDTVEQPLPLKEIPGPRLAS